MEDIYNPSRIEHIKNIMGHHAEMADPGETVYFGLTDDPCQPITYRNAECRPQGVVESKKLLDDGTHQITFRMEDGSYRSVNSATVAPSELFEFAEEAYGRYAEKRRAEAARAEEDVLKEPEYSGTEDLYSRVSDLSDKLDRFIEQSQNQNATFVETIASLANDISTGRAEFSDVFRKEFATFKGADTEKPSETQPEVQREYGDISAAVIDSSDDEQ